MSKYKNKPVWIDGIRFPSTKEGERFMALRFQENNGVISDLELQPRFVLQDKFVFQGEKIRAIVYVADFKYKQDGKVWVEDVKASKNYQTQVYKLKKKMLFKRYPDINFREVY